MKKPQASLQDLFTREAVTIDEGRLLIGLGLCDVWASKHKS